MAIFWCKFGFGGCFGASLSNHWAGHRWLSYKIHFSFYVIIWLRNDSLLLHRIREYNTSKQHFFLIFNQLMWHPFIELCYLSNLHQISNDHRMVNVEFFATSVVAVTGSASMISQERILEWVAISFSRESYCSRDQTAAPSLAGVFLTTEPPGKSNYIGCRKKFLINFLKSSQVTVKWTVTLVLLRTQNSHILPHTQECTIFYTDILHYSGTFTTADKPTLTHHYTQLS